MDALFKLDEVLAFRHELTSESDRGCALMACAYLDDQLALLLRANLTDDSAVSNVLFGHVGPLGSFSSRIDMAYMLALFGAATRRDLHLIRKVRNEFGHVASPITFEHPPVAARCRELTDHALTAKDSPRTVFVQTALAIAATIHAGLGVASRPKIRINGDLTTEMRSAMRERYAMIIQVLENNLDQLDFSSKDAYLASMKRLVLLLNSTDSQNEGNGKRST